MKPYDDYDVAKDIEAIENGVCSGTSYTGAESVYKIIEFTEPIETLDNRLRGDWVRDE